MAIGSVTYLRSTTSRRSVQMAISFLRWPLDRSMAIIGFAIALDALAIILFRFVPRNKPKMAAGFVTTKEEISNT